MHQQILTSRRRFIEVGSLLFGGLGLTELLRLRAQTAEKSGKPELDTAVILLWLEGGPSHMETYDLKPNAPREYRGEFLPIKTNVPGMDVCELMPLHAGFADRMSIIRSISHKVTDHPGAAGRVLTGRRPKNISAIHSEHPTFDSIVGKLREGQARSGIPHFVSNKSALKGGGAAYLGPTCAPFVVDKDPADPDFTVQNLSLDEKFGRRLDDRLSVLKGLDRLRRDVDASKQITAGDRFQQRAIEMLSSTATRDAFDLAREPSQTRDRYGRNTAGQGALLARRLVEAGCSMVTLDWGNVSRKYGTWDDHGDGHHIFKAMRDRLPKFDRALTALIEDLYQRGLNKRVLLVVTGEFGRTPKVNMGRAAKPIWPGRDHWPAAMSVMVSGGGMRMGQVIGSTNSKGEHPLERPLSPNDLLATIYRFLGIKPEASFANQRGRPMPILPYGKVIHELM